jgi:DNA-binding transcriptional regulator PaaX
MTTTEKTMNYQALGEYTAFKQQARDAADRRFALLHNLAAAVQALARKPGTAIEGERLAEILREAEAADRELRAALERANAAAPLCGERELRAEQFGRE